MKKFKGKAIYQSDGAAAEYNKFTCNFYKGCPCNCGYCCNKRWGWGLIPTLKECFESEEHAIEVFKKELLKNKVELQKYGLWFSMSTDPMLPETSNLTMLAVEICIKNYIPVKILTKMANWDNIFNKRCLIKKDVIRYVSFGFTLTGRDDKEPGASSNLERIKAMKKLHAAGYKTWASVEPIIDLKSSMRMIVESIGFCTLYKIGLESGKKYDKEKLKHFAVQVVQLLKPNKNIKIYFKDSFLKAAGINREDLPENCVARNYNVWKGE